MVKYVIQMRPGEYVATAFKSSRKISFTVVTSNRSARKFKTKYQAEKYIEKYYIRQTSDVQPTLLEVVVDMNNKAINIGDLVELHSIIGQKGDNPKTGLVYSLSGMNSRGEPMVWIKGQAAHHPLACIVR